MIKEVRKGLKRLNQAIVIPQEVLFIAGVVAMLLVLFVVVPVIANTSNTMEVSCYQENGVEQCDLLVDVPFKND